MQFSTIAAIAATLVPALAYHNITLSASFEDGSSSPIVAFHEGAGFSYFFATDQEYSYNIDFSEGKIFTDFDEYEMIVTPYTVEGSSQKSFNPLGYVIANESDVFWYLDRPTGGANRLQGVVKGQGSLIKFYAAKNVTYDPYHYSENSFMIGASTFDLDDIDTTGLVQPQEVEIWASIA